MPSQLLERHPDLIAAAINGVNKSKAVRLRQISLTASGGGSSNALSSLTTLGNLAWQAASSLLIPIADGGARKAQIEVDKARETNLFQVLQLRQKVNSYLSKWLQQEPSLFIFEEGGTLAFC